MNSSNLTKPKKRQQSGISCHPQAHIHFRLPAPAPNPVFPVRSVQHRAGEHAHAFCWPVEQFLVLVVQKLGQKRWLQKLGHRSLPRPYESEWSRPHLGTPVGDPAFRVVVPMPSIFGGCARPRQLPRSQELQAVLLPKIQIPGSDSCQADQLLIAADLYTRAYQLKATGDFCCWLPDPQGKFNLPIIIFGGYDRFLTGGTLAILSLEFCNASYHQDASHPRNPKLDLYLPRLKIFTIIIL